MADLRLADLLLDMQIQNGANGLAALPAAPQPPMQWMPQTMRDPLLRVMGAMSAREAQRMNARPAAAIGIRG